MITEERLKNQLIYDPDTGIFKWKVNKGRVKVGDIACNINDTGHVRIIIDGTRYYAHRLAWLYTYGEFPDGMVDHINRVKDDNRIANLRVVSKSQNAMNTKLHKHNTSGYRGVSLHKKSNKWKAKIEKDKVQIQLGLFKTKEEAAEAYMIASIKYFGEFVGST